jgi:hypothetical protein
MAGKALLLALLLSAPAWGQEVQVSPVHLYQAQNPELIGYPNWVATPEGKARIDAALTEFWTDRERLRVENGILQQKTLELAAKPELTWKGALALVGIGLVVGVTGGILLGKRL